MKSIMGLSYKATKVRDIKTFLQHQGATDIATILDIDIGRIEVKFTLKGEEHTFAIQNGESPQMAVLSEILYRSIQYEFKKGIGVKQ